MKANQLPRRSINCEHVWEFRRYGWPSKEKWRCAICGHNVWVDR